MLIRNSNRGSVARRHLFLCAAGFTACASLAGTPALAQKALQPVIPPHSATMVQSPGRTGAVPPAILARSQRLLIGDPVVVHDWQLQARTPPGGPRAFQPFTVAEVQKLMTGSQRGAALGNTDKIKTPKGLVPIAVYVAQLNVWEKWLNPYGVSLRDPGVKGADGVTRLPLHFRLKPISTPNPLQVNVHEATKDPSLIIDPGYPATVMGGQIQVRPDEALSAWAAQHSQLPAHPAQAAPPPPAGPPQPAGKDSCAAGCKLHYGDGAGGVVLSPLGQHIVNDDTWEEVCYQVIDNGGNTIPGCASEKPDLPGKFIKTTKIPHSYRQEAIASYGADLVNALIANYKDPCLLQAKSQSAIATFYVGTPGTSKGNKSVLTGVKAAQFWDGTLNMSWENIDDCVGNTSGNGWFAGYLCLDYGAHAFYTKSQGFDLADDAGIDTEIRLFGQDFPILKGDQKISWRQGPNDPPKTSLDTNNSLGSMGDKLHYATPPFIIPIGPVPLSVTGGLDVSYKLGGLDPKSPNLSAFAQKTVGQMSMSTPIGVEANMSVFMNASIDAVIASAGIEGRVNAFDGSATGAMSTSVDVVKNEVVLDKSYTLDATAFSGSVSAYVEIWYIVGSKRWSVDIVDFPGVGGPGTPIEDKLTGSAVIPDSATTQCDK